MQTVIASVAWQSNATKHGLPRFARNDDLLAICYHIQGNQQKLADLYHESNKKQ
jgi:hypothetical protein